MTDPRFADAETSVQSREKALADTFVHLADTMVDDYDVADLLDQLVNACVNVLGVTAAGLLLDDQRGNLTLVASSSQEIRLLELFVLQNNEGPCLDCVRSGAAVTSSNLDDDRERWPLFVGAADLSGFRSVAAVPLRLRDQTIGGLSLFMDVHGAVSPANQRLAQAFADVATIGILQQRSLHRSLALSEQLQTALTSRIVIEQAKGILAERAGLTMDGAFAALRRHARDRNLKLTDVATAVVTAGLDPTVD
ncbi:MAG TPA: GAF and ANTAR domain-containing protein [Mycobacteriales bacterium]|nr:GAF and ANTAR domain-containing protein [Mycobacteriales bacterium]